MTTVQKKLTGLAALVVVGGVGAALAVWQEQRSEATAKEDAAQKKVLSFTDDTAIREVALTTNEATYTMVREGTADGSLAWRITTPIATAADVVTVEGMIDSLLELSRTTTMGEKPEEPPVDKMLFGLEPPRYTVTVKDDTGKSETIFVGKKNSFDGSLYVQKEGEQRVGLVNGSLEYQLDKDLFKLRDKRLIAAKDADVTSLQVTLAGKPAYTVEKDSEQWRMRAPITTLADSVQVSAIVSALTSANAKSFVTEQTSPVELQKRGLHKPIAKVEVGLAGGGKTTVLVGEVAGTHYATAGGAIVELSSDWLLGKLRTSADELRDKHVLNFDRESVGKIRIKKGAATFAFERNEKEGGGDDWVMLEPEAADAQDATLSGLLYRVWSLKATSIAEETLDAKDEQESGVGAPQLVIELHKKDGTAIGTLRFGKTQADGVYATAGARLDIVDKGFLDDTSDKLEDYKEVDETVRN